jgi:hypothetical protein
MYEEEGYQTRDIPTLILTNNIFGIDIDRRCYQLASFALTMKARSYYSRYLRKVVQPNTIALQNIDHDTIASAGNWDAKSSMWQFENVDTIGSLLQITANDYNKIKIGDGLFGARPQLLKTQAEYLSRKYHCVVTNPPYLGKGMGDILKNYVLSHYPNSKSDTMATFMERTFDFCIYNGKIAMINMQSWMFLSSYEKLRSNLLENYQIDSLLHLGPHAFDEIGGEVVQCATFTVANHKPTTNGGIYYRLVDGGNSGEKESSFLHRENKYTGIMQANFEKIPGCPIGYWVSEKIFASFAGNLALSAVAKPCVGLQTADNARFLRYWHEVNLLKIGFGMKSSEEAEESRKKWFPYNKGGGFRKWYGNQDTIVNWESNGKEIKSFTDSNGKPRSVVRNPDFYFKNSISWGLIASSASSFRIYPNGFIYDVGGMSLFTSYNTDNYCLLGSLNTKFFLKLVKVINPTINMQCGDVARTPYLSVEDSETKERISSVSHECVNISKQDWDAHETSWDFQTNELLTINESNWLDILNDYSLQAGICIDPAPADTASFEWRMSMYKMKWEAKFLQLHSNEEELNRQFIEIYGLQDELTPEVPLNEITILQKGEISIENNEIVWHEDNIIKQLISYLVGCFMGRYSIDKPGLIIASQHQDLNELGLKVEGIDNYAPGRLPIDDDGIVPVIEEEDFFADDMTQRIEQAIKVIFGEENYHANLKYINEQLGKPLREYLFKDFYTDHIDGKMYQKRPIYWLFSSKMGEKKKKGYFKALIYMHRMEPDTLSKLHADYVHPYLNKIERQLSEAEDQTTRDDLTQAQRNKALKLVEELRDKVREVHSFEQQLVEMASHRLSIDLDDGVKANYPKYYPLVEPIKGLESSDE